MATRMTMYGPAVYELKVRGELDESWIEVMGVKTISVLRSPDQETITVLTGRVQDQATLRGLLNRLYRLNLPLVSVRCIDDRA